MIVNNHSTQYDSNPVMNIGILLVPKILSAISSIVIDSQQAGRTAGVMRARQCTRAWEPAGLLTLLALTAPNHFIS